MLTPPVKLEFTALMYAAKKDNAKCPDLLLAAEADVNICTKSGVTALGIAMDKRYNKCVESMIRTRTNDKTKYKLD